MNNMDGSCNYTGYKSIKYNLENLKFFTIHYILFHWSIETTFIKSQIAD